MKVSDPSLLTVFLAFLVCGVTSLAPRNVVPSAAFNPVDAGIAWMNRRNMLLGSAATAASAIFVPLATTTRPCYGASADLASSQVALNNLLKSLRSVPTYCIVNSDGASYMLYKKGDGNTNAKGYAFTSFAGALAVLGDAKRTAEKGGFSDVWKDATITTIPADIAVRLALQPRERQSQKEGIKVNSIIAVVPGADEREAAIQFDSKFKDQSKVPLFFFEGLKLEDDSIPLYFNPRELLEEWQRQNDSGSIPPRIQVLELISMFQYVMRGRSKELPVDMNKIVFVPTKETVEVAAKLKAEGKLVPYKTDRMII